MLTIGDSCVISAQGLSGDLAWLILIEKIYITATLLVTGQSLIWSQEKDSVRNS